MKRAGAGPGLLRRVTSVRWLRVPAEKVHFPHNLFHGVGPGAMRATALAFASGPSSPSSLRPLSLVSHVRFCLSKH